MLTSALRVFGSIVFLSAIIFSIPLAFDVGGRTCGLAFSLALSLFYFFYSTLRLATPKRSRVRRVFVNLTSVVQWLVIPVLMIWALDRFSVDSSTPNPAAWVERTFNRKRAADESIQAWLFGDDGLIASVSISVWDLSLRWSIPLFQLAEGFCSLLVIQAAGQISKWAVNRESGDTWMIGLLVFSASVISSACYFLYRITTFPDIGNVDALLIGAAITCAVFLCGWGIGSGRGNPVESSLLFAYVTLCIYQIFTDYKPTDPDQVMPPPQQPDFPPLPPIIMASYSTLMHLLSNLPSAIHNAFNFVAAAFMTITPSVLISLAYRVIVMYASTRIIPAVRESGARALSQEPSLEDSDEVGQVLGLASWYSPSILISVYTSLLLQHFASTNGNEAAAGQEGVWWISQGDHLEGNIWRWANLWITMLLYGVETYIGGSHTDGLTSHWKVD